MKAQELFEFNEWWETGEVPKRQYREYKRYLFPELLKFLPDRQGILLAGLRRVGKTVLLYQMIHHLLNQGVEPKNILYFSFDERGADLRDVLETYRVEVLRGDFQKRERVFIFLDEIHKVEDWESKVKIYYDLNPNLKFFLSGSAALALSKRSKESLAGRVYEFVLKPLTFREFLEMKGVKVRFEEAELLAGKIQPLFSSFLRKAGFPELLWEEDDEKIRAYVKSAVVERIVYRDIPLEFGSVDIELLEILRDLFLKNPGMFLNIENLARDLGRNKRTIMNYTHYLRFSLLVNLVANLRPGVLATSRKNRRVYPATPALSFASGVEFEEVGRGGAMESLFRCEVGAKYYFRRGSREIDFLLVEGERIIPVEIKSEVSTREISSIVKSLTGLNLNRGLMLTWDKFGSKEIGNRKILIYPLWAFLLFKDEILREVLSE
ncbi:MAG: ATP-binding protein [Candidatus Hadarchaeales archaeon]